MWMPHMALILFRVLLFPLTEENQVSLFCDLPNPHEDQYSAQQ